MAKRKIPKERKYLIACRKFNSANAASLPISGQIATNSKLLANTFYFFLNRWSYRHYGTMEVSLYERREKGLYYVIKR